jgi:hypothetical protein
MSVNQTMAAQLLKYRHAMSRVKFFGSLSAIKPDSNPPAAPAKADPNPTHAESCCEKLKDCRLMLSTLSHALYLHITRVTRKNALMLAA